MPEEIRKVFVVSSDLPATAHVRMQAALQRFVDNSISKTVNFPAQASIEDIKKAYILAWKLKCKGLTVYVAGSREQIVLEAGKKEDNQPYSSDDHDSNFRGQSFIKKNIEEKKRKTLNSNLCPECGDKMQKAEGCVTCPKCGWSKCDV